jgi:TRAP-type mannitol/chloroaromatic compound transport system permease small subunit
MNRNSALSIPRAASSDQPVARFWGASIMFVTLAILYVVVARGWFGQATIWANETTVYLSAVAYLLGGGYALLRHGHVRIDLIYGVLAPGAKRAADVFSFVFFSLYVGALIWVGTQMAWGSFLQSEGSGTPWNPPIWPVKMASIRAAVALQGIVNCRGSGRRASSRCTHEHRTAEYPVRRYIPATPSPVPLAFATGRGRHVRLWAVGLPGLTLVISACSH